MSRIFITGDTHGENDIGKLSFRHWKEGTTLTKNDYLIITGDFGLIWDVNQSGKQEQYWLNWLSEKPWTTLFVCGNHENFDRLDRMPLIDMFGSKVGKITDSIFHLKRGEVYTIGGKTFFTFGGGLSIDKARRIEFQSWWSQEMPSYSEQEKGFRELDKVDYEVDYIITHEAPQVIKETYMRKYILSDKIESTSINAYLDEIMRRVDYKKWFFGHYHGDQKIDKFRLMYYDIEELIIPLNNL